MVMAFQKRRTYLIYGNGSVVGRGDSFTIRYLELRGGIGDDTNATVEKHIYRFICYVLTAINDLSS